MMLQCEWHIDIPFGKQAEVLEILQEWNRAKFRHSEFQRVRGHRLLVGQVGASPSHIIDAYLFESLADFEAAIGSLGHPALQRYSREVAPYIVPGSQHWRIWRVVAEQRPG